MSLTPETTLAQIQADEALQRELYDMIMGPVRGVMWERKVGYNTADRVADGVMAGVKVGLERLMERERNEEMWREFPDAPAPETEPES